MPGALMAIGGAMDLDGQVMKDIYRRASTLNGQVLIVPAASSLENAGQEVGSKLEELGLGIKPAILPVRTRSDSLQAENIKKVKQAGSIFFTGGNQLRLTACLLGTPLLDVMIEVYRAGGMIAGTSAGAAVLSNIMIANGKSGPTPRNGMVQLVSGLGFINQVIIDQHFRQRDRLGRLVWAVLANPGLIGLGVDEGTGAVIEQDWIKVIGKNSVTVVDCHEVATCDLPEILHEEGVAADNIRIHILKNLCSYNLSLRTAKMVSGKVVID